MNGGKQSTSLTESLDHPARREAIRLEREMPDDSTNTIMGTHYQVKCSCGSRHVSPSSQTSVILSAGERETISTDRYAAAFGGRGVDAVNDSSHAANSSPQTRFATLATFTDTASPSIEPTSPQPPAAPPRLYRPASPTGRSRPPDAVRQWAVPARPRPTHS